MKKTIFIVITRSFLIRNILRSGILDWLKQPGCRIIIFLQTLKGRPVPAYLTKEFQDENLIIERIDDYLSNNIFDRLYRFFVRQTSLLVYTDSTWSYSRAGNINSRQRMFFWKYIERFIFSILTKFHVLKTFVRFLEKKILPRFYAYYFDTYKPDVVFSTSIISGIDIAFMKEASLRGIKTIAMTKGWDHASRVLYRFLPDKIIIQNNKMKEYLIKYQRIRGDIIKVCGFPQFDWYTKEGLLMSRGEYISSLGLDPQRKLIFFGSEGAWSPKDYIIVEILAKWVNTEGSLAYPSSLIIRPHYSDIKGTRFNHLRALKNVIIDDTITYSEVLPSGWDPGQKEIKHFVNLMYHSDIVINIASTLTLDACCFDKPVIAINFGVLHSLRSGKDVTDVYYMMDHYQDVLKTNAVDLVKSERELLESVNRYLVHPDYKSAERKVLLDKLCYKVDGNSSRRIADEILSML